LGDGGRDGLDGGDDRESQFGEFRQNQRPHHASFEWVWYDQ
jgi:hypothetical protein